MTAPHVAEIASQQRAVFELDAGRGVYLEIRSAPGWMSAVGHDVGAPLRREWLRLQIHARGPAPSEYRTFAPDGGQTMHPVIWSLDPAFVGLEDVFFDVDAAIHEQVSWPDPAHRPWRQALEHGSRMVLHGVPERVLEVVRRFHPAERLAVLSAVLSDQTERLLQMAGTCPAVLSLGTHGCARSVVGAVLQGEPLMDVIDLAVRDFFDCEPTRLHRDWIRQAPASTGSGPLRWMPGCFVASDAPDELEARKRWYELMSALAHTLAITRATEPLSKALLGFASRHANVLLAASAGRRYDWLRAAIAYCESHGVRPSRRAEPVRFAVRVGAFLEELGGSQLPGQLGFRFPEPPIPGARGRVLRGAALGDAVALAREGHEMHHCVARFAPEAAAGKLAFYALSYRDERLTLSLERSHGSWITGELYGRSNAPPSPAADRAVRVWLARHGIYGPPFPEEPPF
jgi:hypothetical protein